MHSIYVLPENLISLLVCLNNCFFFVVSKCNCFRKEGIYLGPESALAWLLTTDPSHISARHWASGHIIVIVCKQIGKNGRTNLKLNVVNLVWIQLISISA